MDYTDIVSASHPNLCQRNFFFPVLSRVSSGLSYAIRHRDDTQVSSWRDCPGLSLAAASHASVRFFMTAGQVSDRSGAAALLSSLPEAEWPRADRGYDAG